MRDRAIDVAKGLGIFLVVLGHSRLAEPGVVLHRVIFSFHMPLFFLMAGMLLRPDAGVGRTVRTRAVTLLAPYVAVSLAVGLARLPEMLAAADWPAPAIRFAAGVLYGTGATIPWAPLWFLPHLFLASTVTVALLARTGEAPARLLLISAFLILGGAAGVAAIGPTWALPWSADLLPVTVGIMLAGKAVAPVVRAGIGWRAAVGAAPAFAALHFAWGAELDLNRRHVGGVALVSLEAALGIWLCLGLASALAASRAGAALAYLGARTMPILLFHWFLLAVVFAALDVHGVGVRASALASILVACLAPVAARDAAAWLSAAVASRRPSGGPF